MADTDAPHPQPEQPAPTPLRPAPEARATDGKYQSAGEWIRRGGTSPELVPPCRT